MPDRSISIGLALLSMLALYSASLHSYLFFHSLIEIASIIIACSVFLLVWNARSYLEDHYLFLLGIAYLFIAGLDLLHTVAYKGMGFFPETANLSTQLWILARYAQSLSLLAACYFIKRKINVGVTFTLYAVIISFFLGTIFYWGIFPDCYIEGVGLTLFKVASEYLISILLLISLVWLIRIRRFFDVTVHRLLLYSIVCTIGSELAFTQYVSVFSFANMIGHYLKLAAFYLIYKSIIEIGLVKPYVLLFRNLKQREELLKEHTEKLESEIQERIKIRKQLEDSHLEIKQIFNGTADGIRVVGNDFSILRLNDSFLNYIGMTAEDAYQLKCYELFRSDDCHTENCTLQQINNGAKIVEKELIKETPDGRTFAVNKKAKPFMGVNGESLGIIESFNDISERKEMERIIRDERDLFIDGFVVVCKWLNKPGWPVEYISPNVKRVLGYSVKQMTSNNFRYTDIIDEKDLNRLMNQKKAAIANSVDNEQYDPYQIRDADNHLRWIIDHTRFIRNEHGDVEYFYGYLLDISEYKAVEERLENQEKLAHAGRLTALGEMASGMAHELNQPLTVIRLAVDGLKTGLSMDNRPEFELEAVDDIISQVKRAAKIIKNMRTFSRLESDGYQLVNIAEPIENAISYFREQFRTHQIELSVSVDENLPEITIDPQKFEQIVVNFLSNARYAVESKNDYADSSYHMAVSVRAYSDDASDTLIFEVEDNGISMSSDVAQRCLEPFFTKKNVGEGTGLGLSIVNNIVSEFGMTIDIDTLNQKGCLFRITIPVSDPDPQ